MKKDVIFYVERQPKNNISYSQMLLRDDRGEENGLPNMAYDLIEEELESLLKEVGFSVQKINLKSEKHFVTWLAQK